MLLHTQRDGRVLNIAAHEQPGPKRGEGANAPSSEQVPPRCKCSRGCCSTYFAFHSYTFWGMLLEGPKVEWHILLQGSGRYVLAGNLRIKTTLVLHRQWRFCVKARRPSHSQNNSAKKDHYQKLERISMFGTNLHC